MAEEVIFFENHKAVVSWHMFSSPALIHLLLYKDLIRSAAAFLEKKKRSAAAVYAIFQTYNFLFLR